MSKEGFGRLCPVKIDSQAVAFLGYGGSQGLE